MEDLNLINPSQQEPLIIGAQGTGTGYKVSSVKFFTIIVSAHVLIDEGTLSSCSYQILEIFGELVLNREPLMICYLTQLFKIRSIVSIHLTLILLSVGYQ